MKLWSYGAAGKIAATATALAVTGAFGVGAYALTQDGGAFDPTGFASAYGKGADESQKGYQATPEDTDSAANRHNDKSDDNSNSANENPGKDAFSELPNNGDGTTAVSVDPNAKPGTSTAVDDPNAGGNGGGNGNATGPVIDDGGEDGDNAGGNSGGSGGNGGSTTPSNPGGNGGGGTATPDNPSKPDGGSGNGGSGSGSAGSSEGGEGIENPYVPEKGGSSDKENNAGSVEMPGKKVNIIAPSQGNEPCINERVSAWDLFCALDTSYVVTENFQTFYWYCASKEAFDSYDLFKITGIAVQQSDGSWKPYRFDESHKTLVIPDAPFKVLYKYRYSAKEELSAETATAYAVSPVYSRTYLVSSATGKPVGSFTTKEAGQTINLSSRTYDLLKAEGAIGTGDLRDQLVTKYIESWREGNTVIDNELYTPASGYHTVTADLQDTGDYEIKLVSHNVDSQNDVTDAREDASVYYQTLVGIKQSAGARISVQSAAPAAQMVQTTSETALDIPVGIQAVDFEDSQNPYVVDSMSLSYSVRLVNVKNGALVINKSYRVDDANPKLTADEYGVLYNKSMTACLGIPSDTEVLDIPKGVAEISVPPQNALREINVLATSADDIPALLADNLNSDCVITVRSGMLNSFQKKNPSVFDHGNTVMEGRNKYELKDGLLICNGHLGGVPDDGLSAVTLRGIEGVGATSFSSNASVKMVFLKDMDNCAFEQGCFDNGVVSAVVCETKQQADAVKRSLADGSTVDVVDASGESSTTEDGRFEYLAVGDDVILLHANDGIASFTGKLEDNLTATVIGPDAFADNTGLRWLNLAPSVKAIAAGAFSGCTGLNAVIIGSTSTISLGTSAFQGCNSISFFASNAETAAGDTKSLAECGCKLYCPTHYDGYADIGFISFNEAANITGYQGVEQDDGSLVLYGATGDSPWLCLAAPAKLPERVSLPVSTVEIYSEAFKGVNGDGSFEINFAELGDLVYVDDGAFADSGLTGDVVLTRNDDVNSIMGNDAFTNTKITSFASSAKYLDIENNSFVDCKQLTSATLACGGKMRSSISSYAMSGCSALTTITFTGDDSPAILTKPSPNVPFAFGDSDVDSNLTINVPDSLKKTYLREWLYTFTTYADYDDVYSAAEWDLLFELSEKPTTEQVISRTNELILDVENNLRIKLGMQTVQVPTFCHEEAFDGLVFKIDESGEATLVEVSEGLDKIDFTAIDSSRWNQITLQEGAFVNSAESLKEIVLSDSVKVIKDGTFDGCGDIALVLGDALPTIQGGSPHAPFDFGADNIELSASEEVRKQCLEEWPRQALGLDNDKAMDEYAQDVYISLADSEITVAPTKSEVSDAVNAKLREQENRIREWFGIDVLENDEAPSWAYDSPYGIDGSKSKTETGDDSEETVDTGSTEQASDKGEKAAEESDGKLSSPSSDSGLGGLESGIGAGSTDTATSGKSDDTGSTASEPSASKASGESSGGAAK